VRHAGGLDDPAASVNLAKTTIAICLQDALEATQVFLWMGSFAVR